MAKEKAEARAARARAEPTRNSNLTEPPAPTGGSLSALACSSDSLGTLDAGLLPPHRGQAQPPLLATGAEAGGMVGPLCRELVLSQREVRCEAIDYMSLVVAGRWEYILPN